MGNRITATAFPHHVQLPTTNLVLRSDMHYIATSVRFDPENLDPIAVPAHQAKWLGTLLN